MLFAILVLLTSQFSNVSAQTTEIELLTSKISISPYEDKHFTDRGWAYSHIEKYDEALADGAEALLIKPKNIQALLLRGLSKNNKKYFDGAIADYTSVIGAATKYDADFYCATTNIKI